MLLSEELLQEAIHISDETKQASYLIYNKINEILRNVDFSPINNLNKFIKHGTSSFSKTLFNGEVKVSFNITFYNFTIRDVYEELSNYYAEGSSVCIDNKGKNFLCNINIVLKCGALLQNKNIDTITHEIQHIYEQYRIGDEFKERFDVAKIKTLMFSRNETEKSLGEILYLSSNSEKDAFINGAYSEMMANPNTNVKDCFEKTTLHNKLLHFKNLLAYFKQNNYEDTIRRELNISYERFLKYIEKQYQNLRYKTSRIICLAREDKNKQGWH